MNEFTLPVASPMSNEAIIFFTAAIFLGIIFLFLMYSILVEIRTIKTNSTCILNVLRLLIPKDAKESSKPRVIPTPFQHPVDKEVHILYKSDEDAAVELLEHLKKDDTWIAES